MSSTRGGELASSGPLVRSRSDRTGVRPVLRAAVVVAALYVIRAAVGISVLAAGDNTTVEVLNSSIGSPTLSASGGDPYARPARE
jgi:hypothetical protein